MVFAIIKLDPYCIRMKWSLASQVSRGSSKQDQAGKEALCQISGMWQHPFNQPSIQKIIITCAVLDGMTNGGYVKKLGNSNIM